MTILLRGLCVVFNKIINTAQYIMDFAKWLPIFSIIFWSNIMMLVDSVEQKFSSFANTGKQDDSIIASKIVIILQWK